MAKRSGEERIDHTFGQCGRAMGKGWGESLIRILEASVCLQASCTVMTLNPELRLLCDWEGALRRFLLIRGCILLQCFSA